MRQALCIIVFAIVAVGSAGQVKKPQAPAPVLPTVDPASAAALAPLAIQRASLQTQLKALISQYNGVNSSWRIIEGQALAKAQLDPGLYSVDPTGKKFIKRQMVPMGR
jgi:hypothetical protein